MGDWAIAGMLPNAAKPAKNATFFIEKNLSFRWFEQFEFTSKRTLQRHYTLQGSFQESAIYNKKKNPGKHLPGFRVTGSKNYAATESLLTNFANLDFWLEAFFLWMIFFFAKRSNIEDTVL